MKHALTTLGTVVLALLAGGAAADAVRLHDQAGVAGATVTLAEVAELTGPAAEALADVVVLELTAAGRAEADLTMAEVRRRLTEHGVNWGVLSLRGFDRCRVTRLGEPEASGASVETDGAPISNPATPVTLATEFTVRGRVLEAIEQFTGYPRDELVVSFNKRDAQRLDRGALVDRFVVEPAVSSRLGRVPLVVRRLAGGREVERFTLTVDIARKALGLVVTRTVGRGETLTAGSVAIREVELTDDGPVLTDPDAVVGQVAAELLREGARLRPEHIEPPTVIRRGELVTVHCVSGGLLVRTVARATHDAAMDHPVTLRNDQTRETFTAIVTGRREATIQNQAADAAGKTR